MTERRESFENQSSNDRSSSSVPNRKKRKRSLSSVDESLASDEESVDHGNNSALLISEHTKHQTHKIMTGIRLPDLIYPTSLYTPYDQATTKFDSQEDVLKSASVRISSLSFLFFRFY